MTNRTSLLMRFKSHKWNSRNKAPTFPITELQDDGADGMEGISLSTSQTLLRGRTFQQYTDIWDYIGDLHWSETSA